MSENFKIQVDQKIDSSVDRAKQELSSKWTENVDLKTSELRDSLKQLILNEDILDENRITDQEWKDVFDSIPQELLSYFDIDSSESLKEFILWEKTKIYEIKPWDSLWKIAKAHWTSIKEIAELNNIENPDFIKVGQIIKIPEIEPIQEETQDKNADNADLPQETIDYDLITEEGIPNINVWKTTASDDIQNLPRNNNPWEDLFQYNIFSNMGNNLNNSDVFESLLSYTNIDIWDLFQNPDVKQSSILELTDNKPALRDFIDPNTYQNLTFRLENSRWQNMQVAYKDWDWRVVLWDRISNKRALIWKWENKIYNVEQKSRETLATFEDPEILSDSLVRIKCTHREAIKYMQEQRLFDDQWRRIIYFITDTKEFSNPRSNRVLNPDGSPRFSKNFLAFHWTWFDEGIYWKAGDLKITESAIHMWKQSWDFAFLVGRNGMIFQFFDADLGYWALWQSYLKQKSLPRNMNRETIAIEMALRWDGRGTYENWVEELNEAQRIWWRVLADFLSQRYNINNSNFITSKDPVRWLRNVHADDFSDSDRLALGIPTLEQQQTLLSMLPNWRQSS